MRAGSSTGQELTGVVVDYRPGESITVANEQTGARGISMVLRDTVFDGLTPAAVKPGLGVAARYRMVGERRPVADRVRVRGRSAMR
jgi:hypothetical protein